MAVELLTWASVGAGMSAPACQKKIVSGNMDSLLSEHLSNLRGRAASGRSPDARFVSDDARERFLALRDGSGEDFLAAASELAAALISRMDRRTDPGYLVALREADGENRSCAVLKMEVTDSYAGFVRHDPDEGEVLDAIRNLLDTPGRLQKGAVVPDERASSEVIVGDRLLETALYFLDALGIQQVERPSQAVVGLLAIADDALPGRQDEVAARLQSSNASTVHEFLEEVPRIDPATKADLLRRAEQRRRPIEGLDPKRAQTLRKIFRVAGVTISGRVSDMERVQVSRRIEGGWRITIDVDEQPTTEYR